MQAMVLWFSPAEELPFMHWAHLYRGLFKILKKFAIAIMLPFHTIVQIIYLKII